MLKNSCIKSVAALVMMATLSCAQQGSQSVPEMTLPRANLEVSDADKIRLADPTVVYIDGRYYMYGTERPPQTGFPVLTSEDLVQWQVPIDAKDGYALKMGAGVFGESGFWAPQVFPHKRKYYMAYTANENIAFAHSRSPAGPFTQDVVEPLEQGLRQIDPFVFKDDDGKLYLYHIRLNKGNHIYVAEIADDLSGIKPETLTHCITPEDGTWENTQRFKSPVVAEGPTVIKHKGLYYLFYSANHFKSEDYAVGYATSKSPLGPWQRYVGNPILDKDVIGLNGTGHGDMFVGADNQFYYVFHAHASDTEVHPRTTLIVKTRFKDVGDAQDIVEIDGQSTFYPILK